MGFDAGTFDDDTGNLNVRFFNFSGRPLILRDVVIEDLPRVLSIKAMMRDKIGSYMSRNECQDFLNTWILQYVVGNDNVSAAVKAQRPLREAKIAVTEIPGKPGSYNAVAHLRPWLQLEELTTSMRLVARIPAGK